MTSTGSRKAPHVPVLVNEVIAALDIQEDQTLVDGTFGAGGYTRAMLAAGAGRVIGFDRDPDAIEAGRSLVPDLRLTLVEERFSQMDRALAERGIGLVDAIALDIGVSSMQLDRADRGFSFQFDGPLDMRMSKSGLTAAEYLNSAEEADIARVLRDYGEEPRARAIARAIVAKRPVERTAELAAIVRRAAASGRARRATRQRGHSRQFEFTSMPSSTSSSRDWRRPNAHCAPAGVWPSSPSTASKTGS